MQKTILAILLPIIAFSQAVPFQKTDNALLFGGDALRVAFSPQDGSILKLDYKGQPVAIAQPTTPWMNIKGEDGSWLPENARWTLQNAVQTADDTLRLDVACGDWSVHVFTQLLLDKSQIRRWFEIAWTGDKPSKIRHFQQRWFRIPMAEGMFYNLPANRTTSEEVSFQNLTDHAVHRAGKGSRACIFHLSGSCSLLFLTNELATGFDNTNTTLENRDDAVDASLFADIQGHMQPNVYQPLGEYWLWLQDNDAETALTRIHEWHRERGLVPPADRPDWIRRATLYSFHPKGSIGSNFSDWGGFAPSIKQLDRIAELGCNAIWLLPLEDLSCYWPRDYYKFQTGLGTPEEYKQLVDRAHELGMHVLQDIVPHGGSNTYQRAKDHPEWLLQQEDGSTLYYWCFDFNWPTWIDYMKDVARHYVKTYGIDGYRIDACDGSKIPNWNPAIPYSRASQSRTPGGIHMQKAIRDGSREFNPAAATLAETGSNVFGSISDCLYDFTFCYDMMQGLRKRNPETFAEDLRRWLHEQQCTDLPGQIRLRHIESHDSLRAEYWYGPDGMRRAMAISAWIPGIPMVYQDMEDGHGYFFKKVFKIRNSLVEMGDGDADYLAVTAATPNNGLFAVLRTANQSDNPPEQYAWDKGTGPRASIAVVTIGNERPVAISFPISKLPEPLRNQKKVFELMTGQYATVQHQGDNILLSIPHDGIAVFRFGGEPEKMLLPEPSLFQRFISEYNTSFDQFIPTQSPSFPATIPPSSLFVPIDKLDNQPTANENTETALPLVQKTKETLVPNQDAFPPKTEPLAPLPAQPIVSPTDTQGLQTQATWENNAPFVNLPNTTIVEILPPQKEEPRLSIDAFTIGDDGTRSPISAFNEFDSKSTPVHKGLLLRINVPKGTPCDWRIDALHGTWEDRFRTRHPLCNGVVRNIYYMAQGGNVLWNSLFWPFGFNSDEKRILFATPDATLSLQFQHVPTAVFLLDRVGDDHAPHLFIAESLDDVPEFGTCPFSFTLNPIHSGIFSSFGDFLKTLVVLPGQYFVNNNNTHIYFGRSGLIRQLNPKHMGFHSIPMFTETRLYTDAGFGEDGFRYSANDDAEPFTRITRDENGVIHMQFLGTMRGFNRFDTMSSPIDYYLEYQINISSDIDFICGIKNRQPAFGKRSFSAWMLSTNYPQTHAQMLSNGRLLQEGYSDKQRTLETRNIINPFDITEIRFREKQQHQQDDMFVPFILDSSNNYLMKYINWQSPVPPANVFLHNKQFFIAWHDGPPPENDAYGQWRFFSMLICPGGYSSPDAVAPPFPSFAKQTPTKLSALQNPDFEENADRQWFREIVQFFPESTAWKLPNGSSFDTTTAHSGKTSLRIEGNDGEYRLVRQFIPLPMMSVGSVWKASCWVKSDNIQPGSVGWMNGTLRLELFQEGKPVEYRSIAFPREAFDWQQFTVELTVPEGLTNVSIAAGLNGNRGKIWIDDFSLERIDNPPNNKEQ